VISVFYPSLISQTTYQRIHLPENSEFFPTHPFYRSIRRYPARISSGLFEWMRVAAEVPEDREASLRQHFLFPDLWRFPEARYVYQRSSMIFPEIQDQAFTDNPFPFQQRRDGR